MSCFRSNGTSRRLAPRLLRSRVQNAVASTSWTRPRRARRFRFVSTQTQVAMPVL